MLADSAEIFGEAGMIFMTDLLIAEKQDLVFGKGPFELRQLCIR